MDRNDFTSGEHPLKRTFFTKSSPCSSAMLPKQVWTNESVRLVTPVKSNVTDSKRSQMLSI